MGCNTRPPGSSYSQITMQEKLFRKNRLIIAAIALITTASAAAYITIQSTSMIGNFDSISHIRRSLHWYYAFSGNMPPNESLVSYTRLIGIGSDSLEGNIYPPLLHLFGGVVLLTVSLFHPLKDPLASIHILTFTIPLFFGTLIYASGMMARRFGTAGSIMAALICAMSPCAFTYSCAYFLDIPLAAFTALALWMLNECDAFRNSKYSILASLAIICGALIKPTFLVFIAPALIIVTMRMLAQVFKNLKPKIIFLTWMAGLAGAATGISLLIPLKFNLYENISDKFILVNFACALGTAFCFWHAYYLCKKHLKNTLENLSYPSPRQQFLNFMLCAGISASIIFSWYVPMGSLLALGLHEADYSATADLWYGCNYYLNSIARDHVVWIFLPLILIGVIRSIWNKTLRVDALSIISAILLSIFILAEHPGRLSRYTLPQLPMLAWLAAAGITIFGKKIRILLSALSACFWFMFISLWLPAFKHYHATNDWQKSSIKIVPPFYSIWGLDSDFPTDFHSFWYVPCTMQFKPKEIAHSEAVQALWIIINKYAVPETKSINYTTNIEALHPCTIKIYIDDSQKNWHFSEFPYEFIGKPITEDTNYLRFAYPKGSLVIIMSEDSESFEWPGLTFLGVENADESAWFKVFRREE